MNKLILFSTISLLSAALFSAKTYAGAPDYTIHQEYTSTRALGMGNAFTAVVDDHSSLFYNPAALARREDGQVRMFVRAGISDNWMKFSNELKDADNDPQKTSDVIVKHYGEHLYSRVPTVGAMWVRPNWGIAFIPADVSVDAIMNQQLGPSVGVTAYLDTTLAYGYAHTLKTGNKENVVSVGATLKAIHRAYYSDVVSGAVLATDDQDLFDVKKSAEGMTVDMDIGTLWTPPIRGWVGRYAKPTFAFVVRNVGDYGFPVQFGILNKDDPKEPPRLQRRFDVGSKWELRKFWKFEPKLAVDIRDMGHRNWTFKKGTHVGAELYWRMFNWWKGHWSGGMNQGYWTAGFGARLGWFEIDLASWGEEVGTSTDPLESRRYIAELSIDI
jgi:hypothetical protein